VAFLPGKAAVKEEVDMLLNGILEFAPKRCRLFLLEALALKVSQFFEFVSHFLGRKCPEIT
jgi:hypothetical protein